jgi:tRNA(Ile)-lysidine synthase
MQYHYQAVLLAHHADDLAETVLKRTLEGVALPYLGGLKENSEIFKIKLWRPLLSHTKKQIIAWLQERKLKGFYDRTNEDPQFLRGKLRVSIIPQLSQEFGKEILKGLCRIGQESEELRNYLDDQLRPYYHPKVDSLLGSFLDLSDSRPTNFVELKHLIRKFCEGKSFSLSRENEEKAAYFLKDGSANKRLNTGKNCLYIDRYRLFIFTGDLEKLPQIPEDLKKGDLSFGPWKVTISSMAQGASSQQMDWRGLWENGLEVTLPLDEYQIAVPELSFSYPRSLSIGKWWTDHKVPAFLRMHVPVILRKGKVVHEFLTGKAKPINLPTQAEVMKIILRTCSKTSFEYVS